jgi:hypothetical protein
MGPMEHPYRLLHGAAPDGARALAGPNRLRTLWHFVLLLGLLGLGAWATTTGLASGVVWLVGLVTVAVVFDVARTVHEAILPHRILADARGLEVVWAEKAPWRPWMRRRSAAIAWDELLAVRTSTFSVNGWETTELLLDRRTGPTLTIPHGTFAPGPRAVQHAILDERDDRLEAPRREAADVAGFCRDRFATPRTCLLRPSRWLRVSGTLMAALMIIGPTVLASFIGGVAHVVLTAPGLVVGGILLHAAWSTTAPRVLRLSADGLAHGAAADRLALVPWSSIRFARPTVLDGKVVGVRVATHGGRNLELCGDYGLPLDELAVMISPPAQWVLLARERAASEADAASP